MTSSISTSASCVTTIHAMPALVRIAGDAGCAPLQRLDDVEAPDAERRQQADHQAGRAGQPRGEGEGAPVETDDRRRHQPHVVGHRRQHRRQHRTRDERARQAAEHGHRHALEQERADHAAAARAEGAHQRELGFARAGAGQEQVRDVDAGDDEDQQHRAEQHRQLRPITGPEAALHRVDGDQRAPALQRPGLPQRGRHGPQDLRRRRVRHAWAQHGDERAPTPLLLPRRRRQRMPDAAVRSG